MTTKEQITDWFCERNKIKKEELDKYHRYAIATVFKYAQEQVRNVRWQMNANVSQIYLGFHF